jgi:hypothetical protein
MRSVAPPGAGWGTRGATHPAGLGPWGLTAAQISRKLVLCMKNQS